MPQCLQMKRTAHSEELAETHRTWIPTSEQQKQIGPSPTRHLIFTEGKQAVTAHKPQGKCILAFFSHTPQKDLVTILMFSGISATPAK